MRAVYVTIEEAQQLVGPGRATRVVSLDADHGRRLRKRMAEQGMPTMNRELRRSSERLRRRIVARRGS